MKLIIVLLLSMTLTGCLQTLGDTVKDVLNEASDYGRQAPTLAGTPIQTSGCSDHRCEFLDALEARGYELARKGEITWVGFVESFYRKRAELYPNSNDRFGARELMLYQRMLAERMDNGQISEAQWAYLIEKKNADINTRNEMLLNSASSQSTGSSANQGVTCFKQREWSSGFNKNCVYSCLGSEAVQTIRSTELCPLTIIR
jgi:hypothetical protein